MFLGLDSFLSALTAMSVMFSGDDAGHVNINNVNHNVSVCGTATCADLAKDMLSAMRASADPCTNFYDYACGNWASLNPVPPNLPRRTQYTNLMDLLIKRVAGLLSSPSSSEDSEQARMAKDFYGNCIDTDNLTEQDLEPLLNLITKNGGWPLLQQNNWNESKFDAAEVLVNSRGIFGKAKLHPFISEGLFFAITWVPAARGQDKYLVLRPPAFFVPLMFLHSRINYPEVFQAYETYVFNVISQLRNFTNGTTLDETLVKTQIQEMIDFEVNLASHVKDLSLFHPDIGEEIITLRKLQSYIRYATFQKLAGIVGKGKRLESNQKVVIIQADYFQNLKTLFKNTSSRTIANYIMWRIVAETLSETTDTMRELQFQYLKSAFGLPVPFDRSEYCADTSGKYNYEGRYSLWGYALAADYSNKYLPDEHVQQVNRTIETIRATLSNWFNQLPVGSVASQTFKNIKSKLGIPNWIFNADELAEFYKDLRLQGDHFQDHLTFLTWQFDKTMKKFWVDVARSELNSPEHSMWSDNPLFPMAYYNPSQQFVGFTAGFLAPQFHTQNSPLYSRYGKLGFIVAHEFTHGLIKVYEKANARTITYWNPFPEIFQNMDCIKEHYMQLNTSSVVDNSAKRKFSEDFSDVGGLNMAFAAYKNATNGSEEAILPGLEAFSPDQLFFISYAQNWCENLNVPIARNLFTKDIHSPGVNRVIGVLQNSKEFAQAWNCSKDSFMNPAKKCQLWLYDV